MNTMRSQLGINPNLRPATQLQRYIGAGVEAASDPLNLIGGTGLLSKGVNVLAAGMAGVGGEAGGEIGQQVAGLPGQVIGG